MNMKQSKRLYEKITKIDLKIYRLNQEKTELISEMLEEIINQCASKTSSGKVGK